jgi:hypothetical protein
VIELLVSAFHALGAGATAREIGLVATALRDSGDQEVAAILATAFEDHDAQNALGELAGRSRSDQFTALDLTYAFAAQADEASVDSD